VQQLRIQFHWKANVQISACDFNPSSNEHLLLAYIADLELEVDRLRKQGQFLRAEAAAAVGRIRPALVEGSLPETPATAISQAIDELAAVLHDLYDPPGYHPAHDQVIEIAIRPLIEQVFRWQQRMSGASNAILHLELSMETVHWFPARLRHLLDNLISNALEHRDPDKGESRVNVAVNRLVNATELRVTDNGLGMPWDQRTEAFQLFYRSAPVRGAGLGVGLAVVKLLIEQSGGSLTVQSGAGKGSSFTVVLPRYDVGDYLS
jgi:signal transduction histidine kinase